MRLERFAVASLALAVAACSGGVPHSAIPAAGGLYRSHGRSGSAATVIFQGFNVPRGIAVDSAGVVYVANGGGSTLTTVAPDGTLGTLGSGLNSPEALAIDASGNVYVADHDNSAVKRIDPSGGVTCVAGVLQGTGCSGSPFVGPSGVAVDAGGNVYVAEPSHGSPGGVFKIDANGVVTCVVGTLSGSSCMGAPYRSPLAVTVDVQGNVYITNPMLSKRHSGDVYEVAPDGTVTRLRHKFSHPQWLSADPLGDVFVADDAGISRIAGGRTTHVKSGYWIFGIASDSLGNVYASDLDDGLGVVKIEPGRATTPVGYSAPAGLAYGPDGALYFALPGNGAIYRLRDGVVSLAADGFRNPTIVHVDAEGDIFAGDQITSSQARVIEVSPGGARKTLGKFVQPAGIVTDAHGNVFVADTTRLDRFDATGKRSVFVKLPSLATGLAIGNNGNLYCAAYDEVLEISPAGKIAMLGKKYQWDDTSAIAVDPSENVYVVDIFGLTVLAPGGGQKKIQAAYRAVGLAYDPAGYLDFTGYQDGAIYQLAL